MPDRRWPGGGRRWEYADKENKKKSSSYAWHVNACTATWGWVRPKRAHTRGRITKFHPWKGRRCFGKIHIGEQIADKERHATDFQLSRVSLPSPTPARSLISLDPSSRLAAWLLSLARLPHFPFHAAHPVFSCVVFFPTKHHQSLPPATPPLFLPAISRTQPNKNVTSGMPAILSHSLSLSPLLFHCEHAFFFIQVVGCDTQNVSQASNEKLLGGQRDLESILLHGRIYTYNNCT